MHIDRFIIQFGFLTLLLTACKTSQVTAPAFEYDEDLRVHRATTVVEPVGEPLKNNELLAAIPLEGHITQEIDSINRLIIERNAAKKTWDGYTIQIYSGNSRQEAEQAKTTFNEAYPDIEASLIYHQPAYKVKAGAYLDRLRATRQYEEVKILFPRALLIPEKLNLPAYGTSDR